MQEYQRLCSSLNIEILLGTKPEDLKNEILNSVFSNCELNGEVSKNNLLNFEKTLSCIKNISTYIKELKYEKIPLENKLSSLVAVFQLDANINFVNTIRVNLDLFKVPNDVGKIVLEYYSTFKSPVLFQSNQLWCFYHFYQEIIAPLFDKKLEQPHSYHISKEEDDQSVQEENPRA